MHNQILEEHESLFILNLKLRVPRAQLFKADLILKELSSCYKLRFLIPISLQPDNVYL